MIIDIYRLKLIDYCRFHDDQPDQPIKLDLTYPL